MIIDHADVGAYVGCDVSKASLDLFDVGTGRLTKIANTRAGIARWAGGLDGRSVFVVFEATGTYDAALRRALAEADIPFARLNPMRAKRFAEASGRLAKTDALDARMLAEYGQRFAPTPDPAPDEAAERLAGLHRRRDQLVAARAKERTQAKDAEDEAVAASHRSVIACLTEQIGTLDGLITDALAAPRFADAARRLRTVPGIGPVAAATLLALMPELGQLTEKTAPALAGLAPYDHSSGLLKGHRRIAGGRGRVRRALYMAALTATRREGRFQAFYQRLLAAGKAKKLALIAVARKLLVTANAMIRDQRDYAA